MDKFNHWLFILGPAFGSDGFQLAVVHRCGASGSMRVCHAAGPGSIPGRDKFPG